MVGTNGSFFGVAQLTSKKAPSFDVVVLYVLVLALLVIPAMAAPSASPFSAVLNPAQNPPTWHTTTATPPRPTQPPTRAATPAEIAYHVEKYGAGVAYYDELMSDPPFVSYFGSAQAAKLPDYVPLSYTYDVDEEAETDDITVPTPDPQVTFARRELVKGMTAFAWDFYFHFCAGFDELHPVTGVCGNWLHTAASAVDAAPTFLLMRDAERFAQASGIIDKLDFSLRIKQQMMVYKTAYHDKKIDNYSTWVQSRAPTGSGSSYSEFYHQHVKKLAMHEDFSSPATRRVSFFETVIRPLGSFISLHDLSGDVGYLQKAVDLADRLMYAFDHDVSGIPAATIDFVIKDPSCIGTLAWCGNCLLLADVATIQLEFCSLSASLQEHMEMPHNKNNNNNNKKKNIIHGNTAAAANNNNNNNNNNHYRPIKMQYQPHEYCERAHHVVELMYANSFSHPISKSTHSWTQQLYVLTPEEREIYQAHYSGGEKPTNDVNTKLQKPSNWPKNRIFNPLGYYSRRFVLEHQNKLGLGHQPAQTKRTKSAVMSMLAYHQLNFPIPVEYKEIEPEWYVLLTTLQDIALKNATTATTTATTNGDINNNIPSTTTTTTTPTTLFNIPAQKPTTFHSQYHRVPEVSPLYTLWDKPTQSAARVQMQMQGFTTDGHVLLHNTFPPTQFTYPTTPTLLHLLESYSDLVNWSNHHIYSLGPMSDSTFEYLLKVFLATGQKNPIYYDMWLKSMRAMLTFAYDEYPPNDYEYKVMRKARFDYRQQYRDQLVNAPEAVIPTAPQSKYRRYEYKRAPPQPTVSGIRRTGIPSSRYYTPYTAIPHPLSYKKHQAKLDTPEGFHVFSPYYFLQLQAYVYNITTLQPPPTRPLQHPVDTRGERNFGLDVHEHYDFFQAEVRKHFYKHPTTNSSLPFHHELINPKVVNRIVKYLSITAWAYAPDAPVSEEDVQSATLDNWRHDRVVNGHHHLSCFAPGSIALNLIMYKQSVLQSKAAAANNNNNKQQKPIPHPHPKHTTPKKPTPPPPPPKDNTTDPAFIQSLTPEMALQMEDKAVKLMNGCIRGYLFNPITGLAPERYLYDQHGVVRLLDSLIENNYNLRPETIESLYFMYRYTGNEMYREVIWLIVSSIEYYTKTRYGFTNIGSVTTNLQYNRQETFLFSEVFKYAYLAFEEGGDMPVDPLGTIKPPKGVKMAYNRVPEQPHRTGDIIYEKHKLFDLNKYVFNTEGHPIKTRQYHTDLNAFKHVKKN